MTVELQCSFQDLGLPDMDPLEQELLHSHHPIPVVPWRHRYEEMHAASDMLF